MTLSIVQAIGISMSPEYAAQWQAAHDGGPSRGPAPMTGVVLGAVMRQFPGVIKVN